MLLKFLISPLPILATILILAAAIGLLLVLARYLKTEDMHDLYNTLEHMQQRATDFEESMTAVEVEYQTKKEEIEAKKMAKKNKRKKLRRFF